MDMNEMMLKIHNNSQDKGWWQEERTFGEIIALCHSELSEALEEYRNGHALTEIYYSSAPGMDGINYGAKPEGIPSELADCIIRVLDYIAHCGVKWDDIGWDYRDYNTSQMRDMPFGDFISSCHKYLSNSYGWRSEQMRLMELKTLVHKIIDFCGHAEIDIDSAIKVKHDYNKTRSFRHGNKKI